MKNFLKMFVASLLAVVSGVGCLGFILIPMLVAGVVTMVGGGSSEPTKLKSNTILKVDLGLIAEVVEENPLQQLLDPEASTPVSLSEALRAIRLAKNNPNIVGIYIDAENANAGLALVSEVREAIKDFKASGKPVISYADTYSQKGYYLASVADQILMNPVGGFALVGIASSNMMYKGLLDKIGVKAEVFKVGTYKAAVEPYILEHISDANREQIQSYIGGLWHNMLQTISEARAIPHERLDSLVNQGVAFEEATTIRQHGLVDSLIYRNDVKHLVAALIDEDIEADDLHMTSLRELLGSSPAPEIKGDRIAVVTLDGEIMPEQYTRFGGGERTIDYSYVHQLEELRQDDDVKAVVLRINSPGGSAFISEQIYEEVKKLNAVKPVVASMGEVAASGGYYIASASRHIVAGHNTLTGSIGIFGLLQNASELAKRAGLTLDVVKTNRFADFGSLSMMLEPLSTEQKALIQKQVERGYDTFLDRVGRGRNMSPAEVDKVGQGRVWLGSQAKELGLVDELGGLETAIASAARLAELADYSVDYGSTVHNLLEQLMNQETTTDNFVAHLRYLFMSPAERELTRLVDRHSVGFDIKARLPYEIVAY